MTIGAGFFIDLTTVISLGLRVFKEFTADCRAGIASARSFSQSSLIRIASLVYLIRMLSLSSLIRISCSSFLIRITILSPLIRK